MQSNLTVARDWKLRPIKIKQIFGTGMGYGKVKKTRWFFTPKKLKIRKECATEFRTLADYIILGNKYLWRRQNGLHVSWLRQPLLTNSYLISSNNLIENFSICLNVLILGSYSEYLLIYISSLEGNYVPNCWKKKVNWRTENSKRNELSSRRVR